jgi:hypothetical protein
VWTLFLLVTLGIMTLNSMLPFFLESALRLPGESQTLVLGTLFGTAVLSFPLWGRLSARLGKRGALTLGLLLLAGAVLALVTTAPPGEVGPHLLTLTVLAGVGLAAVMMLPWAMLPDVVEFDALASGRRREGLLYALFTFGQKVAGSVGVFANAIAASVFGYVQGSALQAPQTVDGIRLMTGPVSAALFVVAAAWVWTYPITRARHAEAQAALAARDAAAQATAAGAVSVGAGVPPPRHRSCPSRRGSIAGMRELLYEAAKHYRRGKALADRGDARGAAVAFEDALRELLAVRPQRMRDVLLAQVYLSRHQLDLDASQSPADLRLGYAYARTTAEPNVRAQAERLWLAAVASGRHRAPARAKGAVKGAPKGDPQGAARPEAPRGDAPARPERERRTGRDRRGPRPPARAGDDEGAVADTPPPPPRDPGLD